MGWRCGIMEPVKWRWRALDGVIWNFPDRTSRWRLRSSSTISFRIGAGSRPGRESCAAFRTHVARLERNVVCPHGRWRAALFLADEPRKKLDKGLSHWSPCCRSIRRAWKPREISNPFWRLKLIFRRKKTIKREPSIRTQVAVGTERERETFRITSDLTNPSVDNSAVLSSLALLLSTPVGLSMAPAWQSRPLSIVAIVDPDLFFFVLIFLRFSSAVRKYPIQFSDASFFCARRRFQWKYWRDASCENGVDGAVFLSIMRTPRRETARRQRRSTTPFINDSHLRLS